MPLFPTVALPQTLSKKGKKILTTLTTLQLSSTNSKDVGPITKKNISSHLQDAHLQESTSLWTTPLKSGCSK
jgi:hypothetical protein